MNSILVEGGTLVGSTGSEQVDLLILDGKVAQRGSNLQVAPDLPRLSAKGMLVFPGLIDPQVHFREPGLTHKEDLASGSLAAIAGGVTSFMEMPNTNPNTTDPERLADKLQRAQGRAHADHAFFLGATAENAEQLGEWETSPGCAGIKVFMGSSTGTLLVADDATLERVLRSGSRRVAVHSEDEDRLQQRYAAVTADTKVTQHPEVRDVECALKATTRLLNLVEKTGRKVHLLHVSTAEEIALLRERDLGELVTAEVTPNHLFLKAPDCYQKYGSLVQMNPPVRDQRHQEVIRQALVDGVLDCIGSDHAPHSQEEKAQPYPQSPSGIPGVQTILPLLLMGVRDGWLTLQDVLRVASSAPAQVYGIQGKGGLDVGMDGDLVLVDPQLTQPLPLEWLHSKAGFSPYAGWPLAGYPVATVLRGRLAYQDHQPLGQPSGQALSFS